MKLASRELCTGCSACVAVCNFDAIRMESDKEGFLQPRIDIAGCKKCGRCQNVCPILSKGLMSPKQSENKKSISCLTHDSAKWKASSSGGAFYEICRFFGDGKARIYGAAFVEPDRVAHIGVDGCDNLSPLQKSKYVQSAIGKTYIEAKKELEDGRYVIFSGTPCQIAGLRHYLNRDYDSLLCVEFICHGVGSPVVFKKYLSEVSKEHAAGVVSYEFRTKRGWSHRNPYTSYLRFEDGTESLETYDAYMRLFIDQLILRKSCMENCQFRRPERYGDITLADSRSEQELNPYLDLYRNRSVAIGNTPKGVEVVAHLETCIDAFDYPLWLLRKTNPLYFETTKGSPRRKDFFAAFCDANKNVHEIAAQMTKEFRSSRINDVVWKFNVYANRFRKWKELVIYCIIGCTGATLDFTVYALLTKFASMHYQSANFLSVSFGIINNFFLNRQFNFKKKDRILSRLSSFYAVGMFGWLLSACLLWLFIEKFSFNTLIAKLGTIFFVTVVQFCLNKFITFKK